MTIAMADAFSDALGIHVSEESEAKHTAKEVWIATLSTFCFKFIFALTFIIPVLLLELQMAIIASVIWGLLVLGFFSLRIAKEQKRRAWKVIMEHVLIALAVICIAHLIGDWISATFS